MGYRASDETIAGRLRKVVQIQGGAELLAQYFDGRENGFVVSNKSNEPDKDLIKGLKPYFQTIAQNDPDLNGRNSKGRRAYAHTSAVRSEEYLRTATEYGSSALDYKAKIDALKVELRLV